MLTIVVILRTETNSEDNRLEVIDGILIDSSVTEVIGKGARLILKYKLRSLTDLGALGKESVQGNLCSSNRTSLELYTLPLHDRHL